MKFDLKLVKNKIIGIDISMMIKIKLNKYYEIYAKEKQKV